MNAKIKLFIAVVNVVRLLPHLLFYFIFREKCKEDVEIAILHHFDKKCGDIVGFLYLMTFDKTYRNIYYHRIGKIRYFISWLARPLDSFIIGTHTCIGEGMFGYHPFATIINATEIGRHFIVRNNVTIGDNQKDEKPTIGNNVTVNVHSVIYGNIVVGDNVIIGVGAVVNKNVPSNSVVIGNPARIIRLNGKRVDILLSTYEQSLEKNANE